MWSQDQWFLHLFLPHPILTSDKQIKRLIFEVLIIEAMGSWCRENNGKRKILEACMWVLWTWISGSAHWWFWIGLWSGSMFVFSLCFFSSSFFRLCCYDLGLSFWLLDLCSWLLGLIWEEHEEQVVMFLCQIIMISNNVLLLVFYSFAWVWFGGSDSMVIFYKKRNHFN